MRTLARASSGSAGYGRRTPVSLCMLTSSFLSSLFSSPLLTSSEVFILPVRRLPGYLISRAYIPLLQSKVAALPPSDHLNTGSLYVGMSSL